MDERQETKVVMPSRTRRADDGDLDITPMIDITFLLLAFFVVVSKMDPSTQVMMPLAKHGATVPEQEAVIVIVVESDTEEPAVFLGRAKSADARASGSIEDIENQITEYVINEFSDPLKTTVIVKAERKVKFRHIDIVKRAISKAWPDEEQEGKIINIGIEEK